MLTSCRNRKNPQKNSESETWRAVTGKNKFYLKTRSKCESRTAKRQRYSLLQALNKIFKLDIESKNWGNTIIELQSVDTEVDYVSIIEEIKFFHPLT